MSLNVSRSLTEVSAFSNLREYSSIGHMGRVGGVHSGLCARSQLGNPMPPVERKSSNEVRNMLLHGMFYIYGHVV